MIPSKIGVCGDIVGGSLATMLALTECHSQTANRYQQGISAVAVGNPILDWTALSDSTKDRHGSRYSSDKISRRQHNSRPSYNDQTMTVSGLLNLRSVFFSKPETYFDPFASPLLFFRTPSADIPSESPIVPANMSSSDSESEAGLLEAVKKRRSHRKYPPTGMDLVLPHIRVEVGQDCVIKDQGIELIELVRKSFKRTKDETHTLINRSVEVIEKEGMGFWDENHMLQIGQWFGDVLRRP